MRGFAHGLLRDNCITSRVLSRAIIWLSTLNFGIHENTGGHGQRGVHAWIIQLPACEPLEADIVRIGNAWVVLCQDIRNGLSTVQQHAASRKIGMTENHIRMASREAHANYMMLSVKHIMLCHASD